MSGFSDGRVNRMTGRVIWWVLAVATWGIAALLGAIAVAIAATSWPAGVLPALFPAACAAMVATLPFWERLCRTTEHRGRVRTIHREVPASRAEMLAALKAAEIEIAEAADKMHVLGLNHPGDYPGCPSGAGRALREDKAFMAELAQRFRKAAREARDAFTTAGGS